MDRDLIESESSEIVSCELVLDGDLDFIRLMVYAVAECCICQRQTKLPITPEMLEFPDTCLAYLMARLPPFLGSRDPISHCTHVTEETVRNCLRAEEIERILEELLVDKQIREEMAALESEAE